MSEQRFFVVRSFHGREHYAIEHGDFSRQYRKEDKAEIIYRAELWGDAANISLREAIRRYQRGDRMKPRPVAPKAQEKMQNA